jgi:hypothetical protein
MNLRQNAPATNSANSAVAGSGQSQSGHPPTPIQVGIMSDQQRQHSKLYGNYKYERTLDSYPSEWFANGQEPGPYIGPGLVITSPDAPPLSFDDVIKDLKCDADAVVIGVVKSKESQLTDNKEFIFTDYIVTPSEVFKNNPAASILAGKDISVSRPGGRIQINGRTVGAVDSSFKLLNLTRNYLLFLKYIPETGAYRSVSKGTFEISNGAMTAMTEEWLPGGQSRPFGDDLRSFLYGACK